VRIAGHTMGTPEYSLPEAIALFADIGLEGIEIVVQEEYCCGLAPRASSTEASRIGGLIRERGLEAVALTPYASAINSLSSAERKAQVEELRRVIDLAGLIQASFVRIYAGSYPPGTSQSESRWKVLVESMLELGECAREQGVTLAVETHFNTMTPSAELAARLVEEVKHPNVGVLYDQANLTFQGDEDYSKAIPLLAGRIVFAHAKDLVFKDPSAESARFQATKVAVVDEDERQVRSRVVGDGILPWGSILEALIDVGFDGWLSLEYERRWHPQDLPPAQEGMARGAAELRRLLSELRSGSAMQR
jgi:L-ribulose-5-phosphate 3-epimerase